MAYQKQVNAAPVPAEKREQLLALHAAGHFGIDDVIDPRGTRSVIAATSARCLPRKASRGRPDKRHGISPI
ncbi:hypothetical protein QTH89_03850 [Variovorax sp. J22G21]|uniref:hypothetical protein n=1 Tax=Variovorax fucosicus TaxID=3053517 RepID=UPI002575AB65|nr:MULTISPECIES: hypothetical protein [unclassified Variovorax]MDM0041275.1 hypothetical protein [Variovorax sp. J22R193]MDM0060332.1 hypothetical protein [Variovorax sp. J22G21]